MSEIKVDNISKSFGNTCVLKDISFQVKDGHLLSLLGPSGCGKTTLLRIIAGLEYADEGNIFVGEKNLTPIPVEKRNIGVVFQNYALIPHMTVYNNIAYGLKIRKVPRDKIREQVEKYIALIGLEGMMDRKVTQLSGGQQQRVALARALIVEPDILLLDEPLSALDRKIRAEMQYEIRRIQKQVGITTIFVTHDQEKADCRWYVAGEGWRFEVRKDEAFHVGEQVALAIRGEQVSISEDPSENAAECIIKNIIFTGEICRLRVDLCGLELTLSCINIQAENLRAGQKIYFRTNPQMTHYYKMVKTGEEN